MDFFNNISTEEIMRVAEIGGPIIGILLPIIEAFFPILPLVFFVTVNVTVFGFFLGYLFSWIGSVIGSFLLFFVLKKIGGEKMEKKLSSSRYKQILEKIKSKDLSLLFFLYCFPFTPSFLISGTAALANIEAKIFLLALIPSKFIMLISLALIGVNVKSFFENPIKSIFLILLILAFNFAMKIMLEKSSFLKDKKEKQ